ncbi:MAG: prephenate dehydrogenase [Gemmatimonadales bacterium]
MWVRFPPAVPNHERSAIQHDIFESLAVIGLGAIGGSVAWRARRAGVPRVVGYTPDEEDARAAESAGAVTSLAPSAEAALRGVDVVLLAAPPRATLALIDRLAPRLEPGAVLSDVASVKACVVARARAAGLDASFAGGHPLAGTHGSGFGYAAPDLLRGCVVYVCPTGPDGQEAARRIAAFWTTIMEATPVHLDAVEHDRQLAWTSHLPQAVAYTLARVLADRGAPPSAFGTGARDATRLAASNPDLWIDIFLQNRDAVVAALEDTGARLEQLRDLVVRGDEAGLRALLAPATAFRRSLDR